MTQFCPILSAAIFDVTGRDAVRYLNARLSNDVRALKPESGMVAAALNAQGRTQALFRVYRRAVDVHRLVCDGGEFDAVTAAFMQFVVADDVRLVAEPTQALIHVWGEAAEQTICNALKLDMLPTETLGYTDYGHCAAACVDRIGAQGFDLIVPLHDSSRISDALRAAGANQHSEADYRVALHRAGLPSFPEQINDRWSFLESGFTSAVSHTKGCYVGQEVVEKTEALGKLPARLMYGPVHTALDLQGGEPVHDSSGMTPIGTVVSSAVDKSTHKTYLFARIKQYPEQDQPLTVSVAGQLSEFSACRR